MNYRQRPFPSTEFKLLVECCRWSFAGGEADVIRRLAEQVNWDGFLAASRRHRVQGLSWHCLRSLKVDTPEQAASEFSRDAKRIAHENLRAAMLCASLQKAFSRAEVPLLFVKGLTIGQLAYGDPFLKMSSDVDVLVPPERLRSAVDELELLDCRLLQPAVDPRSRRFHQWHHGHKESLWLSADGLRLELHTRLADNPQLIAGIDTSSPRQLVPVAPGIALDTLAPQELFAYLCVHGASSAWFRLKWLADLAGLIHHHSEEELDELYAGSQRLGAARAAAQALLLADRVFGIPLSRPLRNELSGDRSSRWLADCAWSQMTNDAEPTSSPLGTARIHLTQLLLLPGWKFKLTEAARQLADWRLRRL